FSSRSFNARATKALARVISRRYLSRSSSIRCGAGCFDSIPITIPGEKSMTIELQMLVWSIVLGLVYMLVAATASAMQRGGRWAAGSRDEAVTPLTGVAG